MRRNLIYTAPDRSPNRADVVGNVRYQKLVNAPDSGFCDIQYAMPPSKIPWKALCLATALFIFGGCLTTVGTLMITGIIEAKHNDRSWPLLILGLLMFVPGAYHVRIAYYAFCGENGYSFDDIPDFD
uniref:Transmembrane protein 230 n=1 Tax=Plectus sambesii TaxID=2011161 RepID=A0A914VT29_9BILA